MARKGANLEEAVRTYFARQGFFALRGVSYNCEEERVTDIDVWLYGRQSASVRTRAIVDVKSGRSPKAYERILWTRGVQAALGCDRAIVATTDRNPRVTKFARQQEVAILNRGFVERLQDKVDTEGRMSLEQFQKNVATYKEQKQDGDWLKRISDAKSSLVSLGGYPAFIRAMGAFSFFAERVETRPHHREQALRSTYLAAALGCIALDQALEANVYDDQEYRYAAITCGVRYGDSGDARVQASVERVLEVLGESMENGRVIARQARDGLASMFKDVRAEIIAEYFVKEQNASALVATAIELDERAHWVDPRKIQELSVETRAILGVYADFVGAKRPALLKSELLGDGRSAGKGAGSEVGSEKGAESEQHRLL